MWMFSVSSSFAQYNGSLFGPVNVDNGVVNGNLNFASTVTPTTNGNIRYQWRGVGTGTSTAWVGFEWDSRTRVFSFYGNPTFSPNNDVIIRGDMDIGGSAYGWGNPGNFGVSSIETSKRYIFNITDSGSTLSSAPGNDQINLAITEINHTAALVSTPDGANTGLSTTRSGNNIVLQTSSTAENSGSNEELWYQWWTSANSGSKYFVQDTAIAANDSVSIPLSSSAPILREGDTINWLLALTGPSSTSTVSASTGGLLNFDVIAINKSTVVTTSIADDDTAAPVASAFSVANQTDGQIVAGGYTISGTLTDAGSGINNNGATVTGNDFSPNFDILNDANTELAANQLFTTRPADGANGTVSAAAPAIAAGTSIDLGTYKVRVSATDNDEDPTTAANDRTALVDSQVATFTVTDDDTTGPVLSSVTGNAITLSGANYLNTDLASGLALSMSVNDAESGVEAGTANRYGLARGGVAITTGTLSPSFANGGNGTLTATIAAGSVQTVGSYTLYVTNRNYDIDRGTADQESTVNTYSFTVYANTPTITVDPGTLAFGNQVVNTTSAEQSYTVSGINLGADPIVITAPSGYQVSTTSGSGFGSSVNLTPTAGTVNNTTIYVRFVPNNVAGFSANIAHTHTSAATENKAVTGTGTAPNNPATFSAAAASSSSINLVFTLSAQSKPVNIVRNTSGTFTTPSGAPPAVGQAFAGGTVVYNGSTSPQTDTGLSGGTLYYYRAFSYDSVNGQFYSAGLNANATTIPDAPNVSAETARNFLGFTANWDASTGAASYRLDVSYFADFSVMVSGYNNLTVNGTSQAVTVPRSALYFYRVRAVNASGTSANSATRDARTSIAQGVNGGGSSPTATIVAPSPVYVGDNGSFTVRTWGDVEGNWAKWRVVIDTDDNIYTGGLRGNWTDNFSNSELKTQTSPRFTSAGTWYWGMQIDYGGTYGTNFWMVRDLPAWANLQFVGTNVNLTVTVQPLGEPSALSALQDGPLPAERIDLSWTKWNGRNVMVVRSLDNVFTAPTPGQAYTVGNTIGGDTVIYNGSGTSFEDTGLTANTTYYYRFYSENFSYYSAGADANQTTAAAPEPDAPVATAATSVGRTSFTANWNASAGATSYRIDVSRNASFTDLVVADHNPGNVTSYAVSGFGTGHYWYRVRAVNGGGTSDNSNVIEIGTQTAQARNTGGAGSPQLTPATIYVGDTATFGLDSDATLPANNFGRARVWVHTTASLLSGTPSSWSSFVNTINRTVTRQMTSAGTFFYGIQLDYGMPPYSNNFWYVRSSSSYYDMHYNPTGVTLQVTVNALQNPTGLGATVAGQSQVNLSWTKWESRDVMVVRSTGSIGTPAAGVVYTAGQSIPGGGTVIYKGAGTSFNDTGLSPSTTYNYRFFSENFGYYSAGQTVSATTDGDVPVAPTATAATSVQPTSFTANWNASVGATSYRLDVSTANNFSTFVGSYNDLNVGGVTTYSVSGLTGGQTYYYRVRAVNGSGASGNSGTITVVTPATATVEIQSIDPTGPTSGNLNFTATVGATYDVYYSDNSGTTWIPLTSVTAQNATETLAVTENEHRLFKVVVAGANVTSSPSTPHAVVEPTVPSGYSMLSAPVAYDNLSLAGTFGDELKTGLSNGSRLYFMEADGSMTTITLSGGIWTPNYTPVAGQGFFIENLGGSYAPRFSGPVGNSGNTTITVNGAAGGRWNILGLSQGKTRTFAQTFPNGNSAVYSTPPTANWNQNSADVIAIDIGGGVFRRVFRAGDGTWRDASTLAAPNFTFPPGAAVYYQRRGSNMNISF